MYGTTAGGGASGPCNNSCGTIFKITTSGTLTTVYSFCSETDCADGAGPESALVQGSDGSFYGTTFSGGAGNDHQNGTVFRVTAGGTLKTLYTFCAQAECADGDQPEAGLVQDTNGKFYGSTTHGGTGANGGNGVLFSISTGLRPFVETEPGSGEVGAAVKILGANLEGATSVRGNGTAAKFTVVSGLEIRATVPSGATTGKVTVETAGGTLSSNVSFRVKP